jgi:hypothetical protein
MKIIRYIRFRRIIRKSNSAMKKMAAITLLFFISFFISCAINAQETTSAVKKLPRNNINTYVSFGEFNINYERNLILRPKSLTNIRMGFAIPTFNFFEGYYLNPSLVQLLGKKNSHLELNLGIKVIIYNGHYNDFIPDAYVGYRYEKPGGGFIFRLGFNVYTAFTVGLGYKF